MYKYILSVCSMLCMLHSFAQQSPVLHSHNDYAQNVPFWKAYACGFNSIEVDVFLQDGKLFATHDAKEIVPNRTIESLYLDPLNRAEELGLGEKQPVQLLIDFKSEAYTTLKVLVKVLKKYPKLIHNPKYTFVISGNRPKPEDYGKYPDYIRFDYQSLEEISTKDWSKVAIISLGFGKYSAWDGKQPLDGKTKKILADMAATAHSYNKPFRFWGFPDTELAWNTCTELGIDFVNTDHPFECSAYFKKRTTMPANQKIAFLADIHLQDIYGTLSDSDYKGIFNKATGKYTLVRTMQSQMESTRIFNENYFAFIAALEDIAARGIRLIALPGDYSDDGQPLHIRGLSRILHEYEARYGIQFFITTGNHDPVGPFQMESGKSDFLGAGGKAQPIFSKAGMYQPDALTQLPVVVTKDIAKMGYEGILDALADFGFFPNKQYRYWATPFSDYTTEDYSFEKALAASTLQHRTYDVLPGFAVPDVSYVVEPVEGLWLLALDGDVYIPKDAGKSPEDAYNYNGAGLGYNNVLTNKKHLIAWVKKVAAEAKEKNKTLIAFSHFPMVDFNDDMSPVLKELLGENKWQLERVPEETVAEAFADAGIQLHIAGHIHINDTGVRTGKNGHTIINIQSPSLAAYIPGYKILTLNTDNTVEVETVTLDKVAGFNALFPLYEAEHTFLANSGAKEVWNKEVLQSATYHDFMLWHLKELVRMRFMKDWPEPIRGFLMQSNLGEIGQKAGLQMNDNAVSFSGYDLLIDFYKLRNADVLALRDISEEQQKYYNQLIQAYALLEPSDELTTQLKTFFQVLNAFRNGAPAANFTIDLNILNQPKLMEK